jgi:hypothetical protein
LLGFVGRFLAVVRSIHRHPGLFATLPGGILRLPGSFTTVSCLVQRGLEAGQFVITRHVTNLLL